MLTPQGVNCSTSAWRKLVTGRWTRTSPRRHPEFSLTGAGTVVGTFSIAPEQRGQEADARSDIIFAFGAVLYEMFTGERPSKAKSQASLVGAILDASPCRCRRGPLAPRDQIVKTCLAKNPENRWQSAGDVGRQLQWITMALPSTVSAPVPVVAPPVRRQVAAARYGLRSRRPRRGRYRALGADATISSKAVSRLLLRHQRAARQRRRI